MDTIVLSAGHGGKTDNKGISGVYSEANSNLSWCKLLREELKKEFNVVLPRETNVTILMGQRATIAAKYGAILFIDVHSDAESKNIVTGSTVFYSIEVPDDFRFAKELGEVVAAAYGTNFRKATYKESTNEKGKDYYTQMYMCRQYKIPHVILLERAFHSSAQDEQKLLNPALELNSVKAAANVIRKYFGVKGAKEEAMSKIIAHGPKDVRACDILAQNINGVVRTWDEVLPEDDVFKIGGPKVQTPEKPCKSFTVIAGGDWVGTAESVCKYIRTGKVD